MEPDDQLPLLRARAADIAPRVLVVGDPARAEAAAGLLRAARQVGANREYVTYTGAGAGGGPVTVASHGVGAAGAGVCFEELARAGARIFVRAGTCGAVQDDVADGALVIASAAVRDEGLTPRLAPLSYPAVADHRVVAALEAAGRDAEVATHTGVVLTSDLFYPSAAMGLDWEVWKKSRVLAVEMEAAALFVVAALHGLQAGGLFAVDGNPTRAAQDMSEYDPYRPVVVQGKEQMLRLALAALEKLT